MMSDNDKNHDVAGSEMVEREIEVKTRKTIQLVCPVCHEKDFEQILLPGNRGILVWRKYTPTWVAKRIDRLLGAKLVTTYRCRHCDYVMMFAHSD